MGHYYFPGEFYMAYISNNYAGGTYIRESNSDYWWKE